MNIKIINSFTTKVLVFRKLKPLLFFIITVILIGNFPNISFAQEKNDSIVKVESQKSPLKDNYLKKDRSFKKGLNKQWDKFKNASPTRKASIYSLVFPGMGQLYNRSYWKVPVAMAFVGGLGYLAFDNRSQYLKYTEDGNTVLADQARRSMEQYFIYASLAYLVQIFEAIVDAHFKGYDVSDDLSIHISPAIQQITNYKSNSIYNPAISINVTF